jgi:hypothetical protein
VRLYSAKSLKSLGTLVCHKENCQALTFASSFHNHTTDRNSGDNTSNEAEDDEDDMTDGEKQQRARWLVTAGKDYRVSIWGLMSFEKV